MEIGNGYGVPGGGAYYDGPRPYIGIPVKAMWNTLLVVYYLNQILDQVKISCIVTLQVNLELVGMTQAWKSPKLVESWDRRL